MSSYYHKKPSYGKSKSNDKPRISRKPSKFKEYKVVGSFGKDVGNVERGEDDGKAIEGDEDIVEDAENWGQEEEANLEDGKYKVRKL